MNTVENLTALMAPYKGLTSKPVEVAVIEALIAPYTGAVTPKATEPEIPDFKFPEPMLTYLATMGRPAGSRDYALMENLSRTADAFLWEWDQQEFVALNVSGKDILALTEHFAVMVEKGHEYTVMAKLLARNLNTVAENNYDAMEQALNVKAAS